MKFSESEINFIKGLAYKLKFKNRLSLTDIATVISGRLTKRRKGVKITIGFRYIDLLIKEYQKELKL